MASDYYQSGEQSRAICRDCGTSCEYGHFWVIGEDILGDPEVLCDICFAKDDPVL